MNTKISLPRSPTEAILFVYVCDADGKLHFLSSSYEKSVSPDDDRQLPTSISALVKPSFIEEAARHRAVTLRLHGELNKYNVELDDQFTTAQSVTFYERALPRDSSMAIQGVAALSHLDDADNDNMPDIIHYLSSLLTIKCRVTPWSLHPVRSENNKKLSAVIAEILDSHFRFKAHDDQWISGGGRDFFIYKIEYFIDRSLPIQFILPGFPCKSPNKESKVLGTLPDKGEELAFKTMVKVAEMIEVVYVPGVRFAIVSDGHVFSDLLGVPDVSVNEYGRTLRTAVASMSGRPDIFTFHGLDDLLSLDASRATFTEEPGHFPEQLPCLSCYVIPRYTSASVLPAADDARRLLCLLAGRDEKSLYEEIKQNTSVTGLYRGFSRFLLEDLQQQPEMLALPSKNARKQLCSKIAMEMLIRNQAYSTIVGRLFPIHVRISIHPYNCAGPKFGVNLIHKDFVFQAGTLDGQRGDATEISLFHIPTPWHNLVVSDSNGLCIVTKKKDALKLGGEKEPKLMFYEDGRPSHLLIEQPFASLYKGAGTQSKLPDPGSEIAPAAEVKEIVLSSEPTKFSVTSVAASEPYCAYSPARRRFLLFLIALAGGFGPLAGNIYLPAMESIRTAFGTSVSMINLTVSMFMLTFAVAPMGWGTLADSAGRRNVYLISFAIYVAASIALGFSQSYALLLVLRIVQAIGASSVQSLGAGTIADLFKPTERGRAMGIFLLGPQMGPLIGPVLGGFLTEYASWRWIFFFLAGLGAVTWILFLLFLPETLRAKVGNGQVYADHGLLVFPGPHILEETKAAKSATKYNPLAPLRFLRFRSITLCVTYIGIIFGSFYCLNVEIPAVLKDVYGYDASRVGISYIPTGVGFILGSTIGGRYADWKLHQAMSATGLDHVPESRIRSQWVGIILFPVGLALFGFAGHFHWHVSLLLVSLFISVFGMTWLFSCNTTYLIDSFPGSASSVVALNSLFRNPAAALGSAIIGPFTNKVGLWPAFLSVAMVDVTGAALVVIVMIYGAKWRMRSSTSVNQTDKGKP
ncbi:multidrug resistance protein [Spizellomyces punctatus DAOM BR117]|uniref:Multidrug resistance protein n=1 Tax=Spizellomyces punctatus (strain DAOM BR117) TaxID=645134 RepID=A0A0L0H4C1_SPIPD|nr:multidrug resistance protein [Spizellomyces punctatus DAOM BR117]KNC96350.1 multidrug resistance protein [Spizellomyces punctatus DAOM BR117]|eukprot:XP_016604390.1 multidrug resistance protein [Spizellomyces punctatus DAOM BR117]